MIKDTISKLYGFIEKLTVMLETDIDELNSDQKKSSAAIKKNVTDTLSKLVKLITELNKLSKDENLKEDFMDQDDELIIKQYISKNKVQHKDDNNKIL